MLQAHGIGSLVLDIMQQMFSEIELKLVASGKWGIYSHNFEWAFVYVFML